MSRRRRRRRRRRRKSPRNALQVGEDFLTFRPGCPIILRGGKREEKEERDLQEEFRTGKKDFCAWSITRAKCILANLAQIVLPTLPVTS